MSVVEPLPIEAYPVAGLDLLPLCNGDVLDQPTFHERYLQCPAGIKAELLGGTVFTTPPAYLRYFSRLPISKAHGECEAAIKLWLGSYAARTPGVEPLGACSILLGPDDEPEPDAILRVQPDHGGRTREADGYVIGAPELVVEVANSRAAIDLHLKKLRYAEAGIDEYLVVSLEEQKAYWFRNHAGEYREIDADQGVLRSAVFPGLWLDVKALFAGGLGALTGIVDAGLASEEHQCFVDALSGQRRTGTLL